MHADKHKLATLSVLMVAFLFYSIFLYSFLPVENSPVTTAALDGKQVWQHYNCVACHQVYGLGGYLGPDITNAYSIKGPEYIKAFLKNGTDIMPNFHLNDSEIEALTSYLQDMDATGKADPRTFRIEPNGTIANH